MEKRINFGGVGASIGTLFIYAIIFTIAFIFGVWDWFDGGDLGGWNWIGITIALFFSIAIYFFPTLVARDVSSRIEEIEVIRERDGLYKNVRISHPFFWVIFLVNIFFGYTGIVWLIIFLWAHAPGEVTIPNSIAAKLKPEKQADLLPKPAPAPTKSPTKATTPAPSLTPATDLESKLQEVKNLVAKGLLTEDEAAIRRKKIITDE